MDSNIIYNNYINTINNDIIKNDDISNIEIKNDKDILNNFFYNSKYINIKDIYEITDISNNIKFIAVYQIQKLYFCIFLPKNYFNLINVKDNTIFNFIIHKNKIMLFDNLNFFFEKYLNKDEFEQIKPHILNKSNNDNASNMISIDDTNIDIIMKQTNFTREKATEEYYNNNKDIEKIIRNYLNPGKFEKINEESKSTNQNIYKEIRKFLN